MRRKDVGFAMGGREKVGIEDGGEKRAVSSSDASGSGGLIGRYLFRIEAMVDDEE